MTTPVTAADGLTTEQLLESAESIATIAQEQGTGVRVKPWMLLRLVTELRSLRAVHDAAKEDGAVANIMGAVDALEATFLHSTHAKRRGELRELISALVVACQRAEAESAAKDDAIVTLDFVATRAAKVCDDAGSDAGNSVRDAMDDHAATIRAAREAVAARGKVKRDG